MNPDEFYDVNSFRDGLNDAVDDVEAGHVFGIQKDGKTVAVLLSYDNYTMLVEGVKNET